MIVNWPFSKTYRFKCKDGSVKTFYKNVDDALPLYIKSWEGNVSAAAKMRDQVNADFRGEYKSSIEGLLYALDERNQSLMMMFRMAYIAHQCNPDSMGGFFERELEKAFDEQRRITALKIRIEGLINLAKLKPDDPEAFLAALADVSDPIAVQAIPQLTAHWIEEARQMTREMMEGESGG